MRPCGSPIILVRDVTKPKDPSMPTVNILDAKTQLSKLVERVESGAESEIVIARNGRPVARLVPLATRPVARRIGAAVGQFQVPESIDGCNALIDELFGGDATH